MIRDQGPEFGSPGTVGILGAGQLSQMLVESSAKAGVPVRVFAGQPAEIGQFLSQVNVCGFESELIDCGALREAASASAPSVRFVPGLETMERLSEKLEQKRILKSLGIPSAPFVEGPASEADLDSWLESLARRFGSSFVIKWSKHGYDGRGVIMVGPDLADPRASCRLALSRGVKLYAEAKVDFVRELALIGCHSTNGDFLTYPLVISEQEGGICRRVRGPAVSFGINARFETLAVQYAEKIAKALPLHGAFGLELFETREGDLWVNELAPRVHNSGHYSQDGCQADQFENHLRAITGQMLRAPEPQPFFAMLNLLGPQGVRGRHEGGIQNLPPVPSEIALHWYNKEDVFPGRKLGHLNCTASSLEQLTSRMALMENYERGIPWRKLLSPAQK
jgi:5-(carboxyamino)imidazole ribonucleotide synthase